ncbi:MAG TPA: hypothetical protein VLY23_17810 [Candidatus Acidoferrum sp.]|nr:hypothetical protein [Candidatus Acidoferrum sp.]
MDPHDREVSSDVIAALLALDEAHIDFRGPFDTSKGTLFRIGDHILTAPEVLDLFSKGRLTPEGIRDFFSANAKAKPKTSGA